MTTTQTPLRIIVTGGRDFTDSRTVFDTLDRLHRVRVIALVIHGAARGADKLADEWAKLRGIETLPCPADWKRFGKGAGPIRNRQMVENHQPDLLVAFPGGNGTRHMIETARKAGVKVLEDVRDD